MSADEPRRLWRSNNPFDFHKLVAPRRLKSDPMPRLVGYLGFDAGRAFDAGIGRLRARPNPLKTPAFVFGDYRCVVQIDLQRKTTTVMWRGADPVKFEMLTRRVQRALRPALAFMEGLVPMGKPSQRDSVEKERKRFHSMVLSAQHAIARGDIYQANLSLRFERPFPGDPRELYRRVSARNPSPYAALLACDDHWIVSNSPELLLNVEGRRAISRPIAGTRPRGKTRRADARQRGQLLLSPKERAEHIMLVDLERNDLGRVCAPGSVKVTERFAVERYSHVMHIVSQVEGRLGKRRGALDALQALFPGGTITGCPKIRSIEIIENLERVARGPFYGSAGFLCGNGDAIFNILIRTALVKNGLSSTVGSEAWNSRDLKSRPH